ncbi:MAG: lipoyl synthase [Magnetococcales bacterium]|nr:lipoyl synthase [Magnetococcales bacterium]
MRKPAWLRSPLIAGARALGVRRLLREHRLHTVCEEASCPNAGRCWDEGHAAFLILGEVCTRACAFCDVTPGRPAPPDPEEPARLAQAVRRLGLRHVVITSVTRDDLPDGGAAHFAAALAALRDPSAEGEPPTVEALIPDFRGDAAALACVLASRPEVLNHNVETVPRLYPRVRPAARWERSLELLRRAAADSLAPGGRMIVKSGMMLGLGETLEEVRQAMAALRQAGVTALTVGQYLRPAWRNLPVVRYWTPEAFDALGEEARAMGFDPVESHPLARSSFRAGAMLGASGREANPGRGSLAPTPLPGGEGL